MDIGKEEGGGGGDKGVEIFMTVVIDEDSFSKTI